MSSKKSGPARRAILLGVAAAAPASVALAQKPPAQGPEEQKAIAVVNAWVAALAAKDAERAVALMAEDCQYRDDPFQKELKKGRKLALEDIKILLRGLTSMKMESMYAVGSPKNDVLILARRVDEFDLFGKKVTIPMGAYYRVRNGEILEWLDTPLADMPAPPGGFPPPTN